MKSLSLNGSWHATCFALDGAVDFQYEGKVPGCVHTDLSGTVLPNDLFFRDNADKCQWIEHRDFEYSRTFTLDTIPANAELVFDGLDTYTDIF